MWERRFFHARPYKSFINISLKISTLCSFKWQQNCLTLCRTLEEGSSKPLDLQWILFVLEEEGTKGNHKQFCSLLKIFDWLPRAGLLYTSRWSGSISNSSGTERNWVFSIKLLNYSNNLISLYFDKSCKILSTFPLLAWRQI